ncbi:MAG: hypothetical protein Q9174_005807 [Haloplaca sp. 1 TL-2023]
MKLSISLLALALPRLYLAFSTIDVRISLDGITQGPKSRLSTTASYGYKGPGVYRILNRLSSRAIADNAPNDMASRVVANDNANGNDQKWVLANVDEGQVLIMNNGTGKEIEGIPFPGQNLRAAYNPPSGEYCHWRLNSDVYSSLDKSPSRQVYLIESVGVTAFSLDLENNGLDAGTNIVIAPHKDANDAADTPSQAWDLEYLGSI